MMNLTVVMVNFKSDRNKLNSCLESINFETEVLIIDHSNDLKIDQLFISDFMFSFFICKPIK